MKALFERAGGAKHGSGVVNPSKQKKKSIASVSWHRSIIWDQNEFLFLYDGLRTWIMILLPSNSLTVRTQSTLWRPQ